MVQTAPRGATQCDRVGDTAVRTCCLGEACSLVQLQRRAVPQGLPPPNACCGLPSGVEGRGGRVSEEGALGKLLLLPSPELTPLVCVPSCSVLCLSKVPGLGCAPGFTEAWGQRRPLPWPLPFACTRPQHTEAPAQGSSKPACPTLSAGCPWCRFRWPKRKKSLLRKSSVTSVLVAKEVRDPRKSGHCCQRARGLCPKDSQGVPAAQARRSVQVAGASRPRGAETALPPSSLLTWSLPPKTSWATAIKTMTPAATGPRPQWCTAGHVRIQEPYGGAASSLCGLGQAI